MRYRTKRMLAILLILVFFVFNATAVSIGLSEGAAAVGESDPAEAVAAAETPFSENNEDGDKQDEKQDVSEETKAFEEAVVKETSNDSTEPEKTESGSGSIRRATR